MKRPPRVPPSVRVDLTPGKSPDWHAAGEKLGLAIARALAPAGNAIRAAFAARYGKCRVCEAPLAGPSPDQVCEGCHAGEVLGEAMGGGKKGEA